MPDDIMPAAEFKAKCLARIGRLVPAGDEDERPWMALRGRGRWTGDPFAPVVEEREIEALKRPARRRTKRS
jgi:hypothetical protein